MTALLGIEPRDAGVLLAEPDIEFATSSDDLHGVNDIVSEICIIHITEVCHWTA
jgi:hypothetical protein